MQMLLGTSGVTDVDAVAGHDVIAVDRGSDRKLGGRRMDQRSRRRHRKCSLPVRKRSELLSPGQMIDLVPEMDGGSGVGDDW